MDTGLAGALALLQKLAKDLVLGQSPTGDQRIVRGGTITLTLSLGPERYAVPDENGKAYDDAATDLTARKLIPALYHLHKEKQMPADYRVIGFARREKTDATWRQELRQALDQFSRTKPVDEKI